MYNSYPTMDLLTNLGRKKDINSLIAILKHGLLAAESQTIGMDSRVAKGK